MIANAVTPLFPFILQYDAVGPYIAFMFIALISVRKNLIALFLLTIGAFTSALTNKCLCTNKFMIVFILKVPLNELKYQINE